MRATVTQIDASRLEDEWTRLRKHVRMNESELVLLPEMCFSSWFCASPCADESIWRAAVDAHNRWLRRLPELGARIVFGTAPRWQGRRKVNMAYSWTHEHGLRWDRAKTYLPNDDGFWEMNWYDRGPISFPALSLDALRVGFAICTEIWFMRHAREYSRQGIHLLLNPRSTPLSTNAKWLAGGRSAAVVAGAFCLSSNQAGRANHLHLGGMGWICEPDGDVLATTSPSQPFVTRDIDLTIAEAAKSTYPRYVDDSPI